MTVQFSAALKLELVVGEGRDWAGQVGLAVAHRGLLGCVGSSSFLRMALGSHGVFRVGHGEGQVCALPRSMGGARLRQKWGWGGWKEGKGGTKAVRGGEEGERRALVVDAVSDHPWGERGRLWTSFWEWVCP